MGWVAGAEFNTKRGYSPQQSPGFPFTANRGFKEVPRLSSHVAVTKKSQCEDAEMGVAGFVEAGCATTRPLFKES
jgi:hypothetical protein